jgi:hypothetical protein
VHGSKCWYVHYKNEDGKVLGVAIIARDVTEQKRISTELLEEKILAELATEIEEKTKNKAV